MTTTAAPEAGMPSTEASGTAASGTEPRGPEPSSAEPRGTEPAVPGSRRRWKMPWATAGIAMLALLGVLVMLYPTVASWVSQYNQSQFIAGLDVVVEQGPTTKLQQEIKRAHEYNEALSGGALLQANTRIPTGKGAASEEFDYHTILSLGGSDAMGRLRIPTINVDLPIYHGTSDETLAKGVGHLEGTSLPVGGASQHSVLTAHRGLPEATLFNDLHKVQIGERFTIEVFGEVLTYQVIETQTVWPHETQTLIPRYGEDLVTLVTCTPLGINSHRYLVTGERVTPTPSEDVAKAGQRPEIPGFPWWSLILGASLLAYAAVVIRAGRVTGKPTPARLRRED